MSKNSFKRSGKILVIALLAVVISLVIAEACIEFGEYIWFGVTVDGVALGGFNQETAVIKLEKEFKEQYGKDLVLKIEGSDQGYVYKPYDLGYCGDFGAAVAAAFDLGRSGGLLRRWQERQAGIDLELPKFWDKAMVLAKIEPLVNLYYRPAVPSGVILTERNFSDKLNCKMEIVEEMAGYFLDSEAFFALLAAQNPREELELEVGLQKLVPYPTAEIIESWELNHELAKFTTCYLGGGNREVNIGIAAKCLNGTLVYPGQELSLNDLLGERRADKGYLPAPVIVKGKHEDALGGGICQVVSTLYNCILQAQAKGSSFKISQRHPHSLPVDYVEIGKDAAISYGYKDFRFINEGESPVLIRAVARAGKLEIGLSGK